MARFQYPSLQRPPQGLPAPSFGWFAPLAEPRRESRPATLVASGEFSWPIFETLPPPPAAVTLAMWYQEWRPPVRAVPPTPGFQAWPGTEFEADNATVRWHAPFSDPQRFLRDPRYATALSASGESAWPYVQPATDNATARWFAALSEPGRFLREARFVAVLQEREIEWPHAQPASDNANVRWHRAFAEPVRFLRDPRYSATRAS